MSDVAHDRPRPTSSDAYHVTVVVLSWNGKDDTLRCLASLQQAEHVPLTVVVVDNGSVDGSPDAVATSFPDVVLVRLDHNSGFSGGVNTGIAAALERGATAVLLLNNDMVVEAGFIAPLLAVLEASPRAAAVCSQILFTDTPERIWYAGASFRPTRGHHGRNIGFGDPPLAPGTPPYEVDCACGGAMLIPADAIAEVGLFDEELFAYREDLDWSLRARAGSRSILVAPGSVVRHHVSASSGGESSPTSLYYDLRNGLTVAERHAPLAPFATWLRRVESLLAHAAQALLSSRRRRGLNAVFEGWRDFRHGRLGPRR